MSTALRALARKALREDETRLVQLDAQLADARNLLVAQADALEEAEAAHAITHRRCEELLASTTALRDSIAQRVAISSAFRAFPDEVLSEIFGHILPRYTVTEDAQELERTETHDGIR